MTGKKVQFELKFNNGWQIIDDQRKPMRDRRRAGKNIKTSLLHRINNSNK